MSINLNYNPSDKARIEAAENKRGYKYYDFTEETIKATCAKHGKEVTKGEWYALIQMLYPHDLICYGLFESFIVFKIEPEKGSDPLNLLNGKRKDPPYEHWFNLIEEGSDGILLERIITAVEENGITVHESWHQPLQKATQEG